MARRCREVTYVMGYQKRLAVHDTVYYQVVARVAACRPVAEVDRYVFTTNQQPLQGHQRSLSPERDEFPGEDRMVLEGQGCRNARLELSFHPGVYHLGTRAMMSQAFKDDIGIDHGP